MNKSTNRHMNIFESYTQNGNLPIENNISRVFAILLQEYPSLLMLFINKLNAKRRQTDFAIPLPEAEYIVDFQKRADADSFGYVSSVIGVTLSADALESMDVSQVKAEDREYITDISVLYDDTLIFIEAKRHNENCCEQVKAQIEKYKNSLEEKDGVADMVVDFSWKEVVILLMEHKRLFDGQPGRLCEDYLSFLTNHFPDWVPVERLCQLSEDREYEINNRLEQIKAECCLATQQSAAGGAIGLDSTYMARCDVRYDKSFRVRDTGSPCITINVWPADTSTQFWRLLPQINEAFFDKSFRKMQTAAGQVDVKITPYMKLSHFQRGYLWINTEEGECIDVESWLNFARSVVGRRKEAQWDAFMEAVHQQKGFFSQEALQIFKKDFDMIFRNRKQYADVACGFEVSVYLPFREAQKIDKAEGAKLAELICACIDAFKKEMVK